MEKVPMTRDGFNKMTDKYQHMRGVEMKECLQNLSDARDKGDISENAEYEVAKRVLEELNGRMSKIGSMLNNVQIIEGVIDDGTVQMLTYVKFKNLKTGQETEYRIVPETEISLKEGKISPLSPIGKALMNRKPGDEISVEIPSGKLELEVISVRCR